MFVGVKFCFPKNYLILLNHGRHPKANALRCFLKRCSLMVASPNHQLVNAMISEPSNHQVVFCGCPGQAGCWGADAQKKPERKCAHLLGCCWSVFVIEQKKGVRFEVLWGTIPEKIHQQIMKHHETCVCVVVFFLFSGGVILSEKSRKKEQRKISKGGNETLRSNANCQDCFDSSLSKREPMTPTKSFCFHVSLRVLWCMKTQISR